jgi:aspartate aminotransferase
MSISTIGQSISPSPTLRMNAIAAAMRERGEPVIHLGGGEPQSKAPIDALLAATSRINSGEVRYTPADGIPTLKQAIVRYTEQYYGRNVEPENVIASGGAKQAVMVCLQAILDPGDEVLFPSPYWVSYPEMVKLCGGEPIPVRAGDGGFYPRTEDFEARVKPRTKAMLINSPCNPSGAMFSDEFIAGIIRLCEERGIYLIIDDIYHRLVFDDKKPANCYEFAKDLGDDSKLVLVNGVSKSYAMTGFRIGWAVANKGLIDVMTNIQAHQTSGPSVICQVAAVGALDGDQSCVESLRLTLQNNRDMMVDRMRSVKGVKVSKPDGTFYCFVDFSAYVSDSVKLAEFLLDKAKVVTVPGSEFGMDGFLRLSYCGTMKDITAGVDRIRWALDHDSPAELFIGDQKLVRDWV